MLIRTNIVAFCLHCRWKNSQLTQSQHCNQYFVTKPNMSDMVQINGVAVLENMTDPVTSRAGCFSYNEAACFTQVCTYFVICWLHPTSSAEYFRGVWPATWPDTADTGHVLVWLRRSNSWLAATSCRVGRVGREFAREEFGQLGVNVGPLQTLLPIVFVLAPLKKYSWASAKWKINHFTQTIDITASILMNNNETCHPTPKRNL